MPKTEVNFKCTIKSVHSVAPLYSNLDVTQKSPLLLSQFIGTIRAQHAIAGTITVHRSKRDGKDRLIIDDNEISGLRFTLKEDETIFVLYDEKVRVVPGGIGTGAIVKSAGSNPVLAEGGVGSGAQIDDEGNAEAGDGVGGNGYGIDVRGKAGEGWGGTTVPFVLGGKAEAGNGVGGGLIGKTPKVLAHQDIPPESRSRRGGSS